MYFDLHGVSVGISSDSRFLREQAETALVYKAAVPVERPPQVDLHIRMDLAGSPDAAPTSARRLGSFGPDITVALEDETLFASSRSIFIRIDPPNDAVFQATSAAGEDEIFFGIAFILTAALRAHGMFGLHAAALVRDGRGVLLVASSDSGKSTATMALVRQGWQFVTDDALLLGRRSAVIVGRSFRRDFCIDPDHAITFPELAGVEWPRSPSDPGKLRLDSARLFPRQFVRECEPRLLIFPRIHASDESRLSAIASRDAFDRLRSQGDPVDLPIRAWTVEHFRMLADLTAQTTAFELEAGRDVLDRPEQFSRLLIDALASPGIPEPHRK